MVQLRSDYGMFPKLRVFIPVGEEENYCWPRIGITENGFIHQIVTVYYTYKTYYNRAKDPGNPEWDGFVELSSLIGGLPSMLFIPIPWAKISFSLIGGKN